MHLLVPASHGCNRELLGAHEGSFFWHKVTQLPQLRVQVREVCAFLEDELGLVPGWLLSVPVKVILAFAARPLLQGLHEIMQYFV